MNKMKKTIKKITAMMLVFAMLSAMGSGSVYAEEAETKTQTLENAAVETSAPETGKEEREASSDDADTTPAEEDTDEIESNTPDEIGSNTLDEIESNTPEEEEGHGGLGYRPMPWESDAPVIEEDIDYSTLRKNLVDGEELEEDELCGVGDQAIGATAQDRAFPYSYIDEKEIINYLTTYYPDPRDQGNEGTCWAQAALGMSEFYMISHGMKTKDNGTKTGDSINLSELHLAYWAYTNGTPSETTPAPAGLPAGYTGDKGQYRGGGGQYGSSIYGVGGNTYLAATTLMQRRGAADEYDYPYEWYQYPDDSEKGKLKPTSERDNIAFLKNAYLISRKNRQLIKDMIIKNGAVDTTYYAGQSMYDESFCNEKNAAYYCPVAYGINHAVAIVGWDDDYPKENFDSDDGWNGRHHLKPSKDGAWLIRNSWTTTPEIDYNSYFWMSYEDKSMSDVWVYELMDPSDPDFQNTYMYDSQIHGCTIMSNVTKSANIYTANSSEADHETIQAVTFDNSYRSATNIKYTIEIYKDIKDPSKGPESGTLATPGEDATTGTLPLGGIYTIPLKKPVTVQKGENYSVVVKFSDKNSVNLECPLGWQALDCQTGIGENQSYIFRGGKWNDVGKMKGNNTNFGNLLIHALTKNGDESNCFIELDKDSIVFGEDKSVGNKDSFKVTKAIDGSENIIPAEDIILSSDDRTVATVEKKIVSIEDKDTVVGEVTAVGNGKAVITAYYGGIRKECEVEVNLKEHTVTFDAKGGSIPCKDEKGAVTYAEKKTITVCNGGKVFIEDPVKEYHEFVKWLDENEEEFDPETAVIEGDKTISAEWTSARQCDKPKISPESGTGLHKGDKIELSDTIKDAKIYFTFTTDGTDPSDPDPTDPEQLYTDPVVITQRTGTVKIKAVAVKDGYDESEKESAEYTVTPDTEAEWGDVDDHSDRTQWENDPEKIPDGFWVADASYDKEKTYTGTAFTFPNLRVYFGNKLLQFGVDYTVSYSNNKNSSEGVTTDSKKPAFTVKGKGNYSGQAKKYFAINKVDINDTSIETDPLITATYTGKAIKPVPVIWFERGGTRVQLKNNTDFKCEYTAGDNYISEGEHHVKVTGKGNFTGELVVNFTIEPKAETKSIAKAAFTGFLSNVTMSTDPSVTKFNQPDTLGLKLNGQTVNIENCVITYINNKQAGTATVIATGKTEKGYTGTLRKTYTIVPNTFSSMTVSMTGFNNKVTWNAAAAVAGGYQQTVALKFGERDLIEGEDYDLTYKNNKKAGNATMTATGKGRYKGSFSKTFKITAYDMEADTDKTLTITEYPTFYNDKVEDHDPKTHTVAEFVDLINGEYDPSKWKFPGLIHAVNMRAGGAKPKLSLSMGGAILKEGTDYTLSYKNNKVFHALIFNDTSPKAHASYFPAHWPQVTITGKGAYKGKIGTVYFMKSYPVLTDAVVTAPDIVRSNKKKGLYSTPVVMLDGVKLKVGTEYNKDCIYTYAVDTMLENRTQRKAGARVSPYDILKEGTTTWINVAVTNGGGTSATGTYAVRAGTLAKATVKVNGGKAYDYSGRPVCPGKDEITVTVGNTELGRQDYDIVGYVNNDKAGTAKVIIRGKGDYCGEKTANFTIGKRKFLWWELP